MREGPKDVNQPATHRGWRQTRHLRAKFELYPLDRPGPAVTRDIDSYHTGPV
jgi:hypothetical protein